LKSHTADKKETAREKDLPDGAINAYLDFHATVSPIDKKINKEALRKKPAYEMYYEMFIDYPQVDLTTKVQEIQQNFKNAFNHPRFNSAQDLQIRTGQEVILNLSKLLAYREKKKKKREKKKEGQFFIRLSPFLFVVLFIFWWCNGSSVV